MVSQGRHGGNDSALLSTTWSSSGDEDTSVLAPIPAVRPLASSRVPESLPLGREVTITGGDAEKERIVLLERCGVGDGDIGGLRGRVHLGENFSRESLGDSGRWSGRQREERRGVVWQARYVLVEIGLDANLLETGLLSLGQLLDVAVHGVLDDEDQPQCFSRGGVGCCSTAGRQGWDGMGRRGQRRALVTHIDDCDFGRHGEWRSSERGLGVSGRGGR